MTEPSRRERFRPAELIILSAVIAAFGGLVALMSTRDLVLSLIGFGIVFILSLMTIALLVMTIKPGDEEQRNLDVQNGGVLRDKPGPGPENTDG